MTLSETIANLAANRAARARMPSSPGGDRLRDLEDFGADPGNLRARLYVPVDLPDGAPLVVVLHGCTQTAAGYDAGAGWSTLADAHGFALLFPEQRRANNPNMCFNWFQPDDTRRDAGEVASIRAMIEAVVRDHAIDRARIFVTGLSAGGAMTSAMLATYPEIFAGGAIIAGLPYGCAANVSEAMDRMRGRGLPAGDRSAALVRAASSHRGPWPAVSVWHGSGDMTVDPANADAVVAQWRAVHKAAKTPDADVTTGGCRQRSWRDPSGRIVIDEYRIAGMGHGTPLDLSEPEPCGSAGPYMLDAGISSTRRIARSWGLLDGDRAETAAPAKPTSSPPLGATGATLPVLRSVRPTRMPDQPAAKPASPTNDVGKIIEDALRAAGLMR